MSKIAMLSMLAALLSFCDDIEEWLPMDWREFRPLPRLEKSEDGFIIGKIISPSGLLLKSNKSFKTEAGDDIVFQATVRGSGIAYFKLEYFDSTGRWCGFSKQKIAIPFFSEWRHIKTAITITDTARGKTDSLIVTLEMPPGTEGCIKKSTVEIERNDIQNTISFPQEWAAFILDAPVSPTDIQLDMIPEEINNTHAKLMELKDGIIDLSNEFTMLHERNDAIFYSYLYSPNDTEYTICAGADGYMNLCINSESAIDTMKSGNGSAPFHFSNHQAKVRLRKGLNIIVIHFQAGKSKYPRLALAGEDALKNLYRRLQIKKYLVKGDAQVTTAFQPSNTIGEKHPYADGETIAFNYPHPLQQSNADGTVHGIGIKLYSQELNSSVSLHIGKELSLKIIKNEYTNGMLLSILERKELLKEIHLPLELWPCYITFATNGKKYYLNAAAIGTEKLHAAQGDVTLQNEKSVDFTVKCNGGNAEIGDFFAAIMTIPKDAPQQVAQ